MPGRQGHPVDIAPEEIGHNKPTEVALVGDGKAIMAQVNKALANRQWFHPKDTPWRQALTKKAAENAATIKPQIDDDQGPAGYYRALRDVAAWMPKNAILSARAPAPWISASRSCRARTPVPPQRRNYGTMVSALARPSLPRYRIPAGRSSISGRFGDRLSGMEMETLVRYNLPIKIVV